jgi:hypothetical protein
MGPYSEKLRQVEKDIEEALKNINVLCGVKESDTGLAPPALWDLAADKMAMAQEQPLQVFQSFLEFKILNYFGWQDAQKLSRLKDKNRVI